VREVLIEAVEKRFGSVETVPVDHRLEILSENGRAFITADTQAVARSQGLKPINKPVCSPQSIGMTESFFNTFKATSWPAWTLAALPLCRGYRHP
jgi:putative transposase